jgi:hypothetical protein
LKIVLCDSRFGFARASIKTRVNFTNILKADYAPIFLRQKKYQPKIQAPKRWGHKICRKKAAQKKLAKLTPGRKFGETASRLPSSKLKAKYNIVKTA